MPPLGFDSSNPKPGGTTGGTVPGGARRKGGAGQDRVGRDADGRFAQKTTAPFAFRGIEDTVPNVASEARTKEILCKPMAEHNPRLMAGW